MWLRFKAQPARMKTNIVPTVKGVLASYVGFRGFPCHARHYLAFLSPLD